MVIKPVIAQATANQSISCWWHQLGHTQTWGQHSQICTNTTQQYLWVWHALLHGHSSRHQRPWDLQIQGPTYSFAGKQAHSTKKGKWIFFHTQLHSCPRRLWPYKACFLPNTDSSPGKRCYLAIWKRRSMLRWGQVKYWLLWWGWGGHSKAVTQPAVFSTHFQAVLFHIYFCVWIICCSPLTLKHWSWICFDEGMERTHSLPQRKSWQGPSLMSNILG